ncbi:hypothetical protein D8T26_07180 [Vibrio vulnificus]|nr:hypothetical protein CRN59_11980 [Vibrio vulnificus]RZQ88168.1 hypothetical protein D8T26_07180 [Vibrio vulnificus]
MRFTEEGFLNDRNTPDIALIGKMGMVMKTESGESTIKKCQLYSLAYYWLTLMVQCAAIEI